MPLISCPDCGASADDWCHRHGETQPGLTLMCPARKRAERKEAERRQKLSRSSPDVGTYLIAAVIFGAIFIIDLAGLGFPR